MRKENKTLVLDMDGTFVDFYGVEGWKHYLDDLQDATPYRIAKPLVDTAKFRKILKLYQRFGWNIAIVSWLSRVKTEAFHAVIRNEKLNWLKREDIPYDAIIFQDYGSDKQEPFQHLQGIQVIADDNDEILANWNGIKIDAKKDLLNQLIKVLIENENIFDIQYEEI